MQAYMDWPPYQRDNYIGWILWARQVKTQQNRISQMLGELASRGSYTKMKDKARSSRKTNLLVQGKG